MYHKTEHSTLYMSSIITGFLYCSQQVANTSIHNIQGVSGIDSFLNIRLKHERHLSQSRIKTSFFQNTLFCLEC